MEMGVKRLATKNEWSILQGIEYSNRHKNIQMPKQITAQGYDILGVKNMAGNGYIWIMLWPKSPPFYKQIPDGNYVLSKKLIYKLVQNHKISSTVEEALDSHVSK